MDDIINALNYVLDRGSQRLKRYIETKDPVYMNECNIYLDVANIYMYNVKKFIEDKKDG